MAPPSNSRYVSEGLAVALLAGCLIIRILLGLLTNAYDGESRNLRGTGIQVSRTW